jgi:hypothetical protein
MPEVLVNFGTSARGQKMLSLILVGLWIWVIAVLSVGLDLANSVGSAQNTKQNAVRVSGALAMLFAIAGLATAFAWTAQAFGGAKEIPIQT